MSQDTPFQVLSFGGGTSAHRPVTKRKFHRKVDSGCLACRLKKVKCDENKPICMRCRRNGRACAYKSHDTGVYQLTSLTIEQHTVSRLSSVTLMPFSAHNPRNGTPSQHLMQHLSTNWSSVINIDAGPEMIDLFASDALVRSVVLALTAGHLRYHVPGDRSYCIAELFHQSLALDEYRQRLEHPRESLGQNGINALMTSATLFSMLAFGVPDAQGFAAEDPEPDTSWLFSPQNDRPDWLALQTGLRPLLLSTGSFLIDGLKFITLVFTGEATDRWRFSQLVETLDGVPKHWIDFFDLSTFRSSCDCEGLGDVYRAPVTILATVRRLGINNFNLFRTMQFLGKVQGRFRSLVYHKDLRALWIFGYWLGIISRYNLWWCVQHATRGHDAICTWLRSRIQQYQAGQQREMWEAMISELECAREICID